MEQPRTIDPQSGDAWVYGPRGNRMWGRYGAAGLAIVDQQRGILLQHRASTGVLSMNRCAAPDTIEASVVFLVGN